MICSQHAASAEELEVNAGVFGAVAEVVMGNALPFAVGIAFLAGVSEFDLGIGINGEVEGSVDALHHAIGVKHVFDLAVIEYEE